MNPHAERPVQGSRPVASAHLAPPDRSRSTSPAPERGALPTFADRVQLQPTVRVLRATVAVLAATVMLTANCSSPPRSLADSASNPTPASTPPTNERSDSHPQAPTPEPPSADGNEADPPSDDTPRPVPPLELPAAAPGTDEAAAALIADLESFVTTDQLTAGVPWPDLRNPDPVAAYQAAARFQGWMSANNPTPTLVEAYTAPGSPERGWDLEIFQSLNALDLRQGPSDPPYRMEVEALVHPAATGISDALLAQVPPGSAAVVYWDSTGPSDVVTPDGQVWYRDPGWSTLGPWVAIMAPTEVGWQVWWDELTDPPPPASRIDQEPPRRDV